VNGRIVALALSVAASPAAAQSDWPVYGADAGATKYSRLADLDRSNVARLAKAWEWRTEEVARPDLGTRPGLFQATPVMIGDTLWFPTPYNRVVALDAETGRTIWQYDPEAYRAGQPPNGTGFVHRGIAVWSDGQARRVFLNSRWRLIALDAATGRPIDSFGQHGEIDLTALLPGPVNRLHYTNTSPPVVYRDLVIVGNGVADRLSYRGDPPGDVQAFDVRTGRRVWSFSPVPKAGDSAAATWEQDSWSFTGHTNVWAPFTVDVDRGLVFLPVSTPSNDWYGGRRLGANLYAESVVALDAATGRRRWHFQTVHHGLWDYDLPAPPLLGTVRRGGQPIDFVAMPAKTGFLFVFDRVTGRPVWPVVERPVPASDVPGERASPTQPVPTKPAPFAKQGFTVADLDDFTPELNRLARLATKSYRFGPLFTPPSTAGTIASPGLIGGAGWGGGAFDPETGLFYVKATNQPALLKLVRPTRSDSLDADYALDFGASLDLAASDSAADAERPRPTLPINRPPYGTLTAIDLATGDHRWQVVLGDTPEIRRHRALRSRSLPPLGVAGAPGPIVTAGGLLFVTGGGGVLYALDKQTGATLWQADLGARGYAVPMTYRTRSGRSHSGRTGSGRQFVVIATGGGPEPGRLQAFALPTRESP
jgi:quinoprotein glucose dehydrogenase